MSRCITVDDEVYKMLAELKGPKDSFNSVLRRHVYVPARNNEELIEWIETQPPPNVDKKILAEIAKGRGRRSNRRK